jgi:hypothetical protein
VTNSPFHSAGRIIVSCIIQETRWLGGLQWRLIHCRLRKIFGEKVSEYLKIRHFLARYDVQIEIGRSISPGLALQGLWRVLRAVLRGIARPAGNALELDDTYVSCQVRLNA